MGNLRTMRQLNEESAFQLPGEQKETGLEEPPPESEFYFTDDVFSENVRRKSEKQTKSQRREARYQHAWTTQRIQEEMEAYDRVFNISIEELQSMQGSDSLIQSMARLLFCFFPCVQQKVPCEPF